MDFLRTAYLPVPFHYMQRLLILAIFWFTAFFILFYYNHTQQRVPYGPQNLGRELLQQDLADYIHDPTQPQKLKYILEAKLNVDNALPMSEKELLKTLSKISNVPFVYWAETKFQNTSPTKCVKFPSLYDLDFNNVYWQRMTGFDSTFYLFGAYYDERVRVGTVPLVRIIGMVDKVSPPPTFCQFWYDNITTSVPEMPETYLFSKTSYTYMWYKHWGNYIDGLLQPFVISCPVPKFKNVSYVPTSVSLITEQCQYPTNNLKVNYKKPVKKENFAVCVKGLDFLYEDISVRLVEWIELLHLLGAKKIFMYELEVHPNVSKVLSYYAKQGMIELTPLTLPGEQPNLPGFRHFYLKSKLVTKRQNELIPYNDCLYKNLYSYDYIALLDTDEVIMPLVHDNWKDMMAEVVKRALEEKSYSRASYNFRNVYFLDNSQNGKEMTHISHEEGIPRYLHMLQHVYRSKNYTKPGSFVKCFHNTERVVSLHNHFPMNCFGQCTTYSVQTSLAHMQHYRKDCVDPLKTFCNDFRKFTTRDTSVWRFKNKIIRRSTETLYQLGFFKSLKNINRK